MAARLTTLTVTTEKPGRITTIFINRGPKGNGGVIFYASIYGASPSATAASNVIALQDALDAAVAIGGGSVLIDRSGTYEVNDTLEIGSNTALIGVNGVVLKKTANYGEVIVNTGAATRTLNSRITIGNISIDTDNKETGGDYVAGLRGHIALYHVEDVLLHDIYIDNLNVLLFGIHVSNFERLTCLRLRCVGEKDAFHLGPGHDFLFEDCRGDTLDDLFGFQPADYPSTNPETGNIYNGTIIRGQYAPFPGQIGFFLRSVCGAWAAWQSGDDYLIGRRVVNAGKVYVCTAPATATEAANAPTHPTGVVTGADGISWRYDHTGTDTSANIYDITLYDCKNESACQMFECAGNNNGFNHQITPGEELNAWMDNIRVVGGSHQPSAAKGFAGGTGWIKRMTVENFEMSDVTNYAFYATPAEGTTTTTDPRGSHTSEITFIGSRVRGAFLANRANSGGDGIHLKIRMIGCTEPLPGETEPIYGIWPKAGQSGTATISGDCVGDITNSEGMIEGDEVRGYVYRGTAWLPKTLVSGTNIKTINGASVLGSGDLTVTGTGGVIVQDEGSSLANAGTTLNFVGAGVTATGTTGTKTITIPGGSGTGDALVTSNLDQFADVTHTSGKALSFTQNFTVQTGAVTITGNAAGSTLTLGAGASSVSGTNTGDQDLSGYLTISSAASTYATASNLTSHTGNTSNPHGVTKTQVGLGNVTDAAQTLASVVPNTAPSAGQILIGNAGGTAYAKQTVAGDITLGADGLATVVNAGTTNAVKLDARKGSVGTITLGTPVYLAGYNVGGWIEVQAADAHGRGRGRPAGRKRKSSPWSPTRRRCEAGCPSCTSSTASAPATRWPRSRCWATTTCVRSSARTTCSPTAGAA